MRRCFALLISVLVPATAGLGASGIDWTDCKGSDLDAKIAACTRIIDENSTARFDRARAHNFRANALRIKGQLDAAMADYDAAIGLEPEYAFPHNGRGLTWELEGQLERAIGDFDEAIRLAPSYPKPYNNRGSAWHAKGQLDRAVADFGTAIGLDPGYSLAYLNRGLSWQPKGELDRALRDFNEVIALEPDNSYAYLHRGITWRAKGDAARAVGDFNAAIGFDSDLDMAYFNRGVTRFYMPGDLAKALADLDRARELNPQYPYVALWIDIVRQRIGMPDNLMPMIDTMDTKSWPAPILRLFAGELTPANLPVAAAEFEAVGIKDATCEANFYGGMIARRKQDLADAMKLFRAAAERCMLISIERHAAEAELQSMAR